MASIKKERIKDRMIKTAARLWGAQENEIETSFDPLIILMIEACAEELERIGYDISTSHSRLLDRLADLVLPESMVGPKPSSCVVQSAPHDVTTVVNPLTGFYSSQQVFQANNNSYNVDFYFSPAGNFTLLKAQLSYVFAGNKLFHIHENNFKEIIFSNEEDSSSDEVWLAISRDKDLESLKGLSIFFNVHHHAKAGTFYQALHHAEAWLDGRPVTLGNGYYNGSQFELNAKDMLTSGRDYTRKVNRMTAFKYQDRFVHIKSSAPVAGGMVPEAWQKLLSKELINKLAGENLSFLQIKLNRHLSQEIFDGLHCGINAFPAVNLKLNKFDYHTDSWINIIPLPSDNLFFDLQAIRGANSGINKLSSSANIQELERGEAIISNSGTGKTSSREVREMISILTEAIRDQSSYFEDLSNEVILTRLKEINKILAGLEDHLSAATDKQEVHPYLLLRPKQEGEIVTIEYWTTDGMGAHQVKAGSLLFSNSPSVDSRKTFTLTGSAGGRNRVSESQKKSLLKQQLVSGGKIISAEDVKLLCGEIFGDKLQKVDVMKGVQTGSNRTDGFVRSIDVRITYSNKANESMSGELDELCRELKYKLQNSGSPVYPYRVIVENNIV